MKIGDKFKNKFSKAMKSDDFWVNLLSMSFVNGIYNEMKTKKINYKDLAALTNSQPSRITKIMKGDENITIKTMFKLAKAVECDVNISLKPKKATWSTGNHLEIVGNERIPNNIIKCNSNKWIKADRVA